MKSLDKNTQIFFVLVQAGLWEQDVELQKYRSIDFSEILRIAEEQSVIGMTTAGLEHVKDVEIPREWVLNFVGRTLEIEQRNKAMNVFVARLFKFLRNKDIYTLLVKGQGIAQCYERPLWRTSGDIDLFLSKDNYKKTKKILMSIGSNISEDEYIYHYEIMLESWSVELHGTLRGGLWKKLDKVIDECQYSVFYNGCVRSWIDGKIQVFLPRADEDVVFVFAHKLQHFFKGGIGIRQICDWCRLLYSYRGLLNHKLLESRLMKAGVLSEWRVFSALAVKFLGMPVEYVPL